MSTAAVAVCYNATHDDAALRKLLLQHCALPHEAFALHAGAAWRATLRDVVARVQRGDFCCVVNLCRSTGATQKDKRDDDDDDDDDDVTAAMVAMMLDCCRVPYTGCRADTLTYTLDLLYMATWYAPVPMHRFVVVAAHDRDDDDNGAANATRLQPPLVLRSTTAGVFGAAAMYVNGGVDAAAHVDAAVRQHGKLVVCEAPTQSARMHVLVVAGRRARHRGNAMHRHHHHNGTMHGNDDDNNNNNNANGTTSMSGQMDEHVLVAVLPPPRLRDKDDVNDSDAMVVLPTRTSALHAALERHGRAFAKQVLCGRGVALLTFAPSRQTSAPPPQSQQQQEHDDDSSERNDRSAGVDNVDVEDWRLCDMDLDCSLTAVADRLSHTHVSMSHVLDMLVHDACADVQRRCFDVRAKYGNDSSNSHDDDTVSHDDNKTARRVPHEQQGYCVYATRDIAAGEVVFDDEGASFTLTTLPHVMRHWDADAQRTFSEYAWPLDRDGHTYVIWDRNFGKWRPINHSCEPNCVFAQPHSLNVTARRDIAAGEELTMDYVTFCDATMKSFVCTCKTPSCRGVIAPDTAVLQRYGQNTWLRLTDNAPQ